MAVAIRGAPTYADGNGAATLSPAKPTGVVAGDLILLTCGGQNGDTTNKTCPGFTQLGKGTQVGGSGFVSHVLYRIADGSEGSTFTVSSASDNWWVTCTAWQGAAATAPVIGTWAGSGSQVTLSVPGITVAADSLVLLMSDCFGNPALPATWAQVANPTAGEGANKSELFSKSFSGATGSQNITEGGGGWMHGVMIGIEPGVFTPASLTDLVGWHDAADASTFTFGTGTKVAQWNDKSGNARHFAQATGADQMDRTGTLNGLPIIDMAGGFMTVVGPPVNMVTDNTHSISFVARCDNTAQSDVRFLSAAISSNADWSNVESFYIGVADGDWPYVRRSAAVDASDTTPSTDFHVYTVVYSAGTCSLYEDGVLVASNSTSTSAFDIDRVQLGAELGATGSRFDGAVAEMVWWNSAVSADRLNVEAFLTDKWFGGGVPPNEGSATAAHAWAPSAAGIQTPAKPTVIESITNAQTTAGRNPTLTFIAAPLENDIVIMWPGAVTTITVGTLSLWPNVLGSGVDVESDANQIACIYHRVTAAEAAAATKTFTATNFFNVAVIHNTVGCFVRNVDRTTAIDTTGTSFGSANTQTPHVLPAVTPPSTHSLILSAVSKDSAVANAYPTTPSGWTKLTEDHTSTTSSKALYQYNTYSTSGVAVGPTNVTPSAGDEYASITVALRQHIPSVPANAGSATTTWAEAVTAAGTRAPKGSATVVWTEAVTAAGARASRGSATTTWIEAVTAAGKKTQNGSATTTHTWVAGAQGQSPAVGAHAGTGFGFTVWATTAAGARQSRGAAVTTTWTEVVTAAGKKTQNGSAVTTWAEAVTAAGKRTPKASATTTWIEAVTASGKRTPKGSAVAVHTWVAGAQGQAPIPGVKAGSGFVSHTWTPSAVGSRTPKGSATVTWAEAVTASGRKPTNGSAVTTWAEQVVGFGVRTPKGSVVVSHLWACGALGQAPQVGVNAGTGFALHTWPTSAAGKRTPKGASTISVTWLPAAAGIRTVFGVAVVTWIETLTASGSDQLVEISGWWNGQEVVELMWGADPVVDWILTAP